MTRPRLERPPTRWPTDVLSPGIGFAGIAAVYWLRERDAVRFALSYNDTLHDFTAAMLMLPRSWFEEQP